MGMMRKLLMGCISDGVKTLVNTTEPHTSPELMNTPITLTVGASYSVSWAGEIPATTNVYIYPFRIYSGTSTLYDMCDIRLKKIDSSSISISARMFDTDTTDFRLGLAAGVNTITVENRFTVTDVTEMNGITVYTVTLETYVYGYKITEKSDIKNTMDVGKGLEYYDNLAGTFVIKKLS